MKIGNRGVVPLTQKKMDTAPLVLVVDDNADARELYATALPLLGLRVLTAADGREGVARARSVMPDAIVMDLSMPLLEGDQAATILKADLRTRSIPIVALTSHGFIGRAKAKAAGFDGFCTKPCAPQDLARLLTGLLRALRAVGSEETA